MPIQKIKNRSQTGVALVLVLSMTAILLVLGSIGTKMVLESQQSTVSIFAKHGQAANIAQAGLQDAIGWFKQNTPVKQEIGTDPCKDAAFKPVSDFVDPEKHATDDPAIGIVKDIQIHQNIWGRYELKKQPCGSAELSNTVKDISAKRGKNSTITNTPHYNSGTLVGDGNVWYLESEGTVYRRGNMARDANGIFTTGPNDAPNKVISRSSASVEIASLSVNVDSAPLMVFEPSTGSNHSFNSRCNISGLDSAGNAAAAAYYNGKVPGVGSANVSPNGLGATNRGPISVENVFSVSQDELKGMADNVYTSAAQIPPQINFSISYLDGNFNFNSAKSLFGGGLLYVNGNLNLENYGNSIFSGVLYVNGTLTVGRDNVLSGIVIAKRVICSPSSGAATIEYNRSLITTVTQRLALYRENNLTHVIREIK